jgi:hypothetical protein
MLYTFAGYFFESRPHVTYFLSLNQDSRHASMAANDP